MAHLVGKRVEVYWAEDARFYRGKLHAAQYFFRWELPRTVQQAELLIRLDDTCVTMDPGWF